MAKKIEVQIIGDASSLQRALSNATDGSSRFGSALGTLAKTGVMAAGAAGVGAVAITLRQGIKEYTESAKVAAQTNAVIKSTGGVANVTAKEVDGLSTALMRKSGVDDEAIKSGANMLLTFTKVRNEVGAGNDVFTQATSRALDLSVALGKDLPSSALLVGKALNDPVKGMTALTRAGVQFTDQQKKTIASLVESGDILGAQKIILAELTTQFGGSAKALGDTLPGQINKLRESFNNFAGDVVAKAVPSLQRFVTFLNKELIPAEGIVAKLKVVWQGLDTVATDLRDKIQGQIDVLFLGQDVFSVQDKAMVHIDPTVQIDWAGLRQQIQDGFSSALAPDSLSQDLGDKLMAGFAAVAARLGEWAKAQPGKIAGDFRSALNVADITADLQKWIVQPVIQAGLSVTAPARQIGANLLAGVRGGADAIGPLISQTLSSMVTTITQRIPAAASAAAALGARVVSAVGSALERIGSVVLGKLEAVIKAISTTATNAFAMAVGVGSGIISGIISGLSGLAGRVAGAIADGVRAGISLAGRLTRGSGDFMFTKHTVGQPMAEGIIEGLAETLAGRLPKNLSSTLLTAMGAAGIDKSATDGGTGIGTSLKGGIDTFLEDKLPDNLAQVLGLAFDEATANFSQAALGVTWTSTPTSAPPMPVALGPSRLADPDAGTIVVNIHQPIGNERQLQDMVVSALSSVRGRGGLGPS